MRRTELPISQSTESTMDSVGVTARHRVTPCMWCASSVEPPRSPNFCRARGHEAQGHERGQPRRPKVLQPQVLQGLLVRVLARAHDLVRRGAERETTGAARAGAQTQSAAQLEGGCPRAPKSTVGSGALELSGPRRGASGGPGAATVAGKSRSAALRCAVAAQWGGWEASIAIRRKCRFAGREGRAKQLVPCAGCV